MKIGEEMHDAMSILKPGDKVRLVDTTVEDGFQSMLFQKMLLSYKHRTLTISLIVDDMVVIKEIPSVWGRIFLRRFRKAIVNIPKEEE